MHSNISIQVKSIVPIESFCSYNEKYNLNGKVSLTNIIGTRNFFSKLSQGKIMIM